MSTAAVEKFNIIGLAIRTTNENGQSSSDIPQLWNQFLSANSVPQIPNKIDNAIYCVYTNYEQDHTKPYTTLLGCRVKTLDSIPEGFTGKSFSGGNYKLFTAKGKIADDIVFQEWLKIWDAGIERAYTADFEVYGEKAQNADKAEVDIFIAIK